MNALKHRLYNHLFGELMLLCITHFYIKIADNFNLISNQIQIHAEDVLIKQCDAELQRGFIKEWFIVYLFLQGDNRGMSSRSVMKMHLLRPSVTAAASVKEPVQQRKVGIYGLICLLQYSAMQKHGYALV